jgi:S1-C subfamily serine protease
VITSINGVQIDESNSLRNIIAASAPGAEVTMTVLRDGREQQLRATLGELQNQNSGRPTGRSNGQGNGQSEQDGLGMAVTPMTPELASRLGLPGDAAGLVVTDVDPAGAAGAAGLQPGDVIEQVNRQPVRSQGDLNAALARAGSRPPLLLVNRRGSSVYLTLRPRG